MSTVYSRTGLRRPQAHDLGNAGGATGWSAVIQAWLDKLDAFCGFTDIVTAWTARQNFQGGIGIGTDSGNTIGRLAVTTLFYGGGSLAASATVELPVTTPFQAEFAIAMPDKNIGAGLTQITYLIDATHVGIRIMNPTAGPIVIPSTTWTIASFRTF